MLCVHMALQQVSERCIASQGSRLMQTMVRLMGLKVGNIHRLKDCGIVTSAEQGSWKPLTSCWEDGKNSLPSSLMEILEQNRQLIS